MYELRMNPVAFTWLWAGIILILSLSMSEAASPFESQIQAFERADQENPPPAHSIVFVGSSSIVRWTDLEGLFTEVPILNRGFGGSTMKDVLFYFDRLIAVYEPALVLVYEGDNDLATGNSVAEVYEDYVAFVGLMKTRLPASDFGFISVKPSPSRIGLLSEMADLNRELEVLALENDGYFLDVFSPMLDEAGDPMEQLFSSDRLHLNAGGYRLWNRLTTPLLKAWFASKNTPLRFKYIQFENPWVIFEWEGNGRLQSSENVGGPWNPVDQDINPFQIQSSKAVRQFFRLQKD